MRIALLGRTRILLETGKLLKNQGHEIGLVARRQRIQSL
jgi:hypothetical protein